MPAQGPNGRAHDRTAYLPERRKMMQVWADYMDQLKASAWVIPIQIQVAELMVETLWLVLSCMPKGHSNPGHVWLTSEQDSRPSTTQTVQPVHLNWFDLSFPSIFGQ